MNTFYHIVQVHPLENGEPNLYKVKREEEFNNEWEAYEFIDDFNENHTGMRAVYVGKVNDETGELE